MWGFLCYALDKMGLLCELNGIKTSFWIAINKGE